jgi:hypothetical protein
MIFQVAGPKRLRSHCQFTAVAAPGVAVSSRRIRAPALALSGFPALMAFPRPNMSQDQSACARIVRAEPSSSSVAS